MEPVIYRPYILTGRMVRDLPLSGYYVSAGEHYVFAYSVRVRVRMRMASIVS